MDLDAFFQDYAEAYNQALTDKPDFGRIRAYFADCFVSAGPQGVKCGANDEAFQTMLESAYGFYRAIGTRRMNTMKVEATKVDDLHLLAKVAFRADIVRKDGTALPLAFQVAYLMQAKEGSFRIFAFVAEDEMALYKKLGLVNEKGEPV